jgi:phosphatidylserine/phosphatidylglycerophosphate/cardiolipin synthase-like enzyme
VDEAELVGGVLFAADNPVQAASVLLELLVADRVDPIRAREAGLEPVLVESVRRRLAREARSLELACAKGAAWLQGRRSAVREESWEVVASLRGSDPLPPGLRRTTGETMIGLVASAERNLRLAAPYMDEAGVGFLVDTILAATLRGVNVELFAPRWGETSLTAVSALAAAVRLSGNSRYFRLVRIAADAPFAHLKVLVADGTAAYIGSANITGAGLAGRNLELGVLVRGRDVEIINRVLDLYREADSPTDG